MVINLTAPVESLSASTPASATILLVEDDPTITHLLSFALRQTGYDVLTAGNGREALEIIAHTTPDLVVSDIGMPEMDGLELLARLRADPATVSLTVILLTSWNEPGDIVKGLDLGADDYLAKPIDLDVLRARVRARLNRPPVPENQLERERRTGLFKLPAFLEEVERELARTRSRKSGGCVACITLDGYDRLAHRLGNIHDPVGKQIAEIMLHEGSPLEVVGRVSGGQFVLLMPELSVENVRLRLKQLALRIMEYTFVARQEHVRFTPVIGFAPLQPDVSAQAVYEQATAAAQHAARQLDLEPVLYQRTMQAAPRSSLKTLTGELQRVTRWTGWRNAVRPFAQLSVMMVISLLLPFIVYVLLGPRAEEVTHVVYLAVIVALLGTAGLIWYEGLLALRHDPLPEPRKPYPPASAIIPAYLPNEAATIMSTIEAFLRLDYPGPLQIILAYNTPRPMPIERDLQAIAERDARFTALRVTHSTSKAQNVNAALEYVTGEFVGIFDADHQPDPDSFRRAWSWLSNGCDVVQGHCLIRNGDSSAVARIIAVEFEAIYAVSHPGRARLHDFGVFGGSNGFWNTALLRATRMHGFMLTEDIDSSMRIVEQGYKIKSDPLLISRELAPTTWSALWNQRMRWAQGWFQVSLKHTPSALFRSRLNWRQKLGILHLLVWREIYPWISIQILPIIAYWAWAKGGLHRIDWFVPIFVVTTLVTLGTGPGQLIFIALRGDRSITQHKGWLWQYLLLSFFYAEYKNLIGRMAQIKEISGERKWKTTPRN